MCNSHQNRILTIWRFLVEHEATVDDTGSGKTLTRERATIFRLVRSSSKGKGLKRKFRSRGRLRDQRSTGRAPRFNSDVEKDRC